MDTFMNFGAIDFGFSKEYRISSSAKKRHDHSVGAMSRTASNQFPNLNKAVTRLTNVYDQKAIRKPFTRSNSAHKPVAENEDINDRNEMVIESGRNIFGDGIENIDQILETEEPPQLSQNISVDGLPFSTIEINSRPNRGETIKEIRWRSSEKKNKTVLNRVLHSFKSQVPPKPPSTSNKRQPVPDSTSQVEALQATVSELKQKLIKQSTSDNEKLHQAGIQKEENFYSDIGHITKKDMKNYLIKQIYEIKQTKDAFQEQSQKLKELLHQFQIGRDLFQIREQLSSFLDSQLFQMNFELLLIESKRELEKAKLEHGGLKKEND